MIEMRRSALALAANAAGQRWLEHEHVLVQGELHEGPKMQWSTAIDVDWLERTRAVNEVLSEKTGWEPLGMVPANCMRR